MTAQLQSYADAFTESRDRARALADGLSDDAFNWKPAARRWSVAECVVHLNTVAERDVPAFWAAADPSGPRAEGPFQYGFFARLFIRAVTPGSRPLPTMPAMKPPAPATPARSDLNRDAVLAAFDVATDGFLSVIERADGLDLRRIRVASPFAPAFRISLGAYLDALGQHALRHVGQAERVAAEPGFPAG